MKTEVLKNKLPPVDRLFDSRGITFLARHRVPLVVLSWLATRGLMFFMMGPVQDVKRYFDTGGDWLHGLRPYDQFVLEYPPGSLLLFAIPRYFTENFGLFTTLFCFEMLAIDLLILGMLWQIHTLLLGPKGATDNVRRYDTAIVALVYIGLTFLLEPHIFQRYDLAASVVILAWLMETLRGTRRWLPDLFIALGIWLKLIPAILIPLYLGYLFFTDRSNRKEPLALWTWCRKQGLQRVGSITGITALLFLPFILQSGEKFLNLFNYHSQRGLQIESTYSSILLFMHGVFGEPLRTSYIFGATEIIHPMVRTLANLSFPLSALGVLAVSWWFLRRMAKAEDTRARNCLLLDGSLAVLLTFIAFTKVFSPQYLLWVAPLVACLALHDQEKTRHWLLGFGVTFFLTCILLMFYYVNLIMMEPLAVGLLLTRNAMLLTLIVVILDVPQPAFLRHPTLQHLGDLVMRGLRHPALPYVALAFAALWCFTANLAETTANDIFIQLRYGDDFLRTGKLPDREIYSATVEGRPFLAHEWLSGAIFAAAVQIFGDGALSIFTAALALLCFVLMHFSIEKEQRRTAYHLILLIALTYLVSFRVLVRPHIFTLAIYCALALALERWRRSGKWRELLWLLPMQLVWVNLHGASLFGPCFLFMLCGCVTVMVLFPVLQGSSEVRRFGKKDIIQLGTMGVLMTLSFLVNPYGLELITFSIDLLNNAYARERVWEWTSPFLWANLSYYWFWLYVCSLVTVWAAVLIRIRSLPLIDFAVVALMTFFSVRANRFVPDLAIFAFPIISRSLAQIFKNGVRKEWNVPRPWLDLAFLTLLFANSSIYGFAHSAREHRPLLGWGFGGDMPYEATQIMKKLGLRGVIFNEYSDGSLIIHDLYPDIRPVLDSRIDLYPWDVATDYDRAYSNPQYFPTYLQNHHVNIVLLYKNRSHPGNIMYLNNDPSWQKIMDATNRVLYVKRPFLRGAAFTAGTALK